MSMQQVDRDILVTISILENAIGIEERRIKLLRIYDACRDIQGILENEGYFEYYSK